MLAIAALGGVWYWSRQAPAPTVAAPDDTTAAQSGTTAAPESAAAAKPLPRLDSASLLRAQKAADSVAAAAKADSLLRAPLARYAKAFETDNLEAVIQAYPSMKDDLRSSLRRFLEGADHIHAQPTFGPVTQSGDRAELEFQVHLQLTTRGTVQPTNTMLRYHAVLARENGAWTIAQLIPE